LKDNEVGAIRSDDNRVRIIVVSHFCSGLLEFHSAKVREGHWLIVAFEVLDGSFGALPAKRNRRVELYLRDLIIG
jgi:hypothetical protein